MSYLKTIALSLVAYVIVFSFTVTAEAPKVEVTIPATVEVKVEPVYKSNYSHEEILSMIDFYSDKYGVSRELAHFVAKNESGYREIAEGDLTIICKEKSSPHYGKIVYARGIYQLTQCYHYIVSDIEAFDAKFNIEYGIKLMRTEEMCKSQFTECRNYYNQSRLPRVEGASEIVEMQS